MKNDSGNIQQLMTLTFTKLNGLSILVERICPNRQSKLLTFSQSLQQIITCPTKVPDRDEGTGHERTYLTCLSHPSQRTSRTRLDLFLATRGTVWCPSKKASSPSKDQPTTVQIQIVLNWIRYYYRDITKTALRCKALTKKLQIRMKPHIPYEKIPRLFIVKEKRESQVNRCHRGWAKKCPTCRYCTFN